MESQKQVPDTKPKSWAVWYKIARCQLLVLCDLVVFWLLVVGGVLAIGTRDQGTIDQVQKLACTCWEVVKLWEVVDMVPGKAAL